MWAEGWRGHRWLLNLLSLWPVLTFLPVWSTQARLLHRNDCVRPSFPGSFIYGVPNFYVRSFLQGEENMVEKETENAVSSGSGSVRVAFGEEQWLGRGGPGPARAQHTASMSRPDNSRRLLCCPLVTAWGSNLPTAHPQPRWGMSSRLHTKGAAQLLETFRGSSSQSARVTLPLQGFCSCSCPLLSPGHLDIAENNVHTEGGPWGR